MSDMFPNYSPLSCSFEKLTNQSNRKSQINISNGKNCSVCSKSSVCKYREVITEEVERLVGELEKKDLPLSININCNEFLQKQTARI